MPASAVRLHAQDVLRHERRRRHGALARLPVERRAAVDALVEQVVAAVVEGILDHARSDPLVAAALDSVYGSRPVAAPVRAAPD